MVKVFPKKDENISSALRRFRKICEKEGIIRDARRYMAYEKPSDKKRREKIRSIKRARKIQEEEDAAKGIS